MSRENEPGDSDAIKRYLSIPAWARNEFEWRSITDYSHLLFHHLTLEDIPDGSILPFGNEVATDEKGRKFFIAPDVFNPPILTPKDN